MAKIERSSLTLTLRGLRAPELKRFSRAFRGGSAVTPVRVKVGVSFAGVIVDGEGVLCLGEEGEQELSVLLEDIRGDVDVDVAQGGGKP